ncbi:MAG: RHS repeat-associated core domain-containing protein [Flavobacterium sp.]
MNKIVIDNGVVITTNYLGGFQYSYVDNGGYVPDDPGNTDPPIDTIDPVPTPPVETSRFSAQRGQSVNQEVPSRPTLQFFPTAEGYFDNINQKYVFQYKDHLGNVRISYAKNPITNVLEIIEESNYYPFGLKHQNYNGGSKQIAYNYKFLGQERQDELGLNWDTFRHRNYDYAIGRFFGVDPVSEEYMSISTYQFAHNNPVWKIEIEGLEGAPSNGKQDISNHEPIKVKNTPVQGFVGGGLIEVKVIQKTTTEAVKEVAAETTKKTAGPLLYRRLQNLYKLLLGLGSRLRKPYFYYLR